METPSRILRTFVWLLTVAYWAFAIPLAIIWWRTGTLPGYLLYPAGIPAAMFLALLVWRWKHLNWPSIRRRAMRLPNS